MFRRVNLNVDASFFLTNTVESVGAGLYHVPRPSIKVVDELHTAPRLSTEFSERAFSHAAWNALLKIGAPW